MQSFQGKSSPYGVAEENLNPIALALAYDVSFVARGYSGQLKHLTDLMVEGINHKGFSFLHALSPCVSCTAPEPSAFARCRCVRYSLLPSSMSACLTA